MGVPQQRDWPIPKSPTLREIARCLRARSKAIRNKVSKFDISVSEEQHDNRRFERLAIDIQKFTGAEQYTQISFAFWHDFTLRIDAQRPADGRRGWDYKYGRFGDFTDVETKMVAELIESTISTFSQAPDTIEQMWSICDLTPIDT